MDHIKHLRQGIKNAREAFAVCAARGVDVKSFADARAVYLPSWLAAFGFWLMLKRNKPARRIMELHNGAEELKRIYYDVLETGERMGVPMPEMRKMRPYVDRLDEDNPRGGSR